MFKIVMFGSGLVVGVAGMAGKALFVASQAFWGVIFWIFPFSVAPQPSLQPNLPVQVPGVVQQATPSQLQVGLDVQ